MSRKSVTDWAPWRFDSLAPSGPWISGTWAKRGMSQPIAWYTWIWRNALVRWSSPRITWVMRMSWSSTTTACW